MTIDIGNPATTSFLDGSSVDDTHEHDDLSDLQNALNELDKAYPEYREAEEFYDGDVPEVFASLRLRRALARTGEPYKINFARKPVDLITEKLTITAVTVPDNPDANTALQAILKRNKWQIQHKDMLMRAGEYGDANILVWPDVDDTGDPVAVDMYLNSPHCTRVFYDTENPLVKAFSVKKWTTGDRVRVNLYYPDRIEKYRSEQGRVHQIDASGLEPYVDDEDGPEWPAPNPFGEVPMFHLHNANPYGVPEHKDFYGVQQILTKLITGHMSTVDYAAVPQRYALADPEIDRADPGDDDNFGMGLEGDEDSGAADDPQSQLSADPGSVWLLQGMKAVGQFDVADPKGFLDPMLTYLRMGAQVTDMPVNRIDPTGAVQSGDSRRIAEAPFLAKVADRQTRYGDEFKAAFEFALKILGFEDADVVITWAPLQTVEDTDGWTVVKQKIEAGMPPRDAFLAAGCTQEQVDVWFPYEEDVSLGLRVEILLKLGQALQALGVASGFQLIDADILRGLVDALLARLDEAAAKETGLEPANPPPPPAVGPATPPPPVMAGGGGDGTSQPK